MKKSRFLGLSAACVLVATAVVPSLAQDTTLTVLCTPQEDWCVAMTQAFEAQTGIDTNYVRLSSGEALARVRATADNPEFSVWWGGPADAFIAAIDEGLLAQYESPNAAAIPEEYKDSEGYWTGVYVGALGFCSNLEILSELGVEPPTSWQDLLAPELQGYVAMAHPATSGTAFTAFWTVVTLEADKLEYPEMMVEAMETPEAGEATEEVMMPMGTGEGYDQEGFPTQLAIDNAFAYFTQMHQNILQYTRSGAAPGTMAGQGEIGVAVIFSHDCVKLQNEGFEGILVNTFPEEGTGYEIGGMAILEGAPEPDAARLWYDWALTAEAQEIGPTVNSLQLPTNPDAAVDEKSVNLSEVTVVDYNFEASGANRTAIAERFDAEIAPQPQE